MSTLTVLRRLVLYRGRQLGALAALAFLLSCSVVTVASVVGASTQAVRDGVAADHGGFAYAVQVTGGTGTAALVDAQPGMHAVADQQVSLVRGDLRTEALSRRSRGSMALAQLVAGQWPTKPGEAALSRAVCEALDARPGDRVDIVDGDGKSRPVAVTGVVVNTADLADRLAISVQPDLGPEDATLWLTERHPYAYPALVDALDRTAVGMIEVSGVADRRARDLPAATASIRLLPAGLAVLVGALLLAAMAGFFPTAVSDVRAMTAAGLTPRDGWRLVVAAAAGSVMAGEAVGAMTALAVVAGSREQLGERLGQAWLSVPLPTPAMVATLVLTVLFFVVVSPVTRGLSLVVGRAGRRPRAVAGRTWSGVVAAAWLVILSALVALLVARSHSVPDRMLPGLTWASAAASAASAVAALSVTGARLGRGSKEMLLAMARSTAPLAATGALLASLAGAYVSTAVHNSYVAQAIGGAGHRSAGAKYLSLLPERASSAVRELYDSVGGRRVERFLEPDESESHTRVSTTGLLRCLEAGSYRFLDDMPVTCYPQLPTASMNLVLLSPDPAAPVEADRYLVIDGAVAILQLKTIGSLVLKTAEILALPDPALGGNPSPGLVVPVGGKVARKYDLVPSGTEFLVLRDFASLTPVDQSRIRAMVARLAPTAWVQDTTEGDFYSRQRSVARAVALAAAALAFLLMLVGGLASYLGSKRALEALYTLSAGRRYRVGLLARLFAAPTLALLVSPALVALRNAALDGGAGAPYGVAWAFPAAGGLAGLTIVILVWLRVPRSVRQ